MTDWRMIFELEMPLLNVVSPNTDLFFHIQKREYLSGSADIVIYSCSGLNYYIDICAEPPRMFKQKHKRSPALETEGKLHSSDGLQQTESIYNTFQQRRIISRSVLELTNILICIHLP
jgi:hypothetical protein